MEWISVKDRLPNKKGRAYLVFIGDYSNSQDAVEVAWFDGKLEINDYPELEDGITHWMPLPEPPKSKQ